MIKLLGEGSYGKVYKVQRASDDGFYAMKETNLSGLSQMERSDAVNEVRLLVSINHTNIVSAQAKAGGGETTTRPQSQGPSF